MRGLLILLFTLNVHGAESFITKEEYAVSLYHNPRGVGCHLCHGEKGEGRHIATYHDKKERKAFTGKPINKIPFSEFYRKVNDKIVGMPRYYLTDTEIQTLYYHLHREEFQRAAMKQQKKTAK